MSIDISRLDFIPVKSSQIDSVAYDTVVDTIYIKFKAKKNGVNKIYSYKPFSINTFKAMLESDSLGKYFHKNIRGVSKGQLIDRLTSS
jgi:hypothetical protein